MSRAAPTCRALLATCLAVALGPARPAEAFDLLLLTGDGLTHRVASAGRSLVGARVQGARHLAVTDGGIAVLGERLELLRAAKQRGVAAPKELRFIAAEPAPADKRALVLGVYADGRSALIDVRSGRADALPLRVEFPTDVYACSGLRFFAHWVEIVETAAGGHDRRYKLPGHPTTVAAGGDFIYAATKEGALWEIDRRSRKERDLGLGGWHGALSMAVEHGKLYVVTRVGKLWEIDPRAGTSTIIDMEGWPSALALRAATPDACSAAVE